MIALGLIIQILVLFLERRRQELLAKSETPVGWWSRTAAKLRPQHFVLLVVGWLGLFVWQQQSEQLRRDAELLKELQKQVHNYSARLGLANSSVIPSIYGDPPVPFRPRHAKALTHDYYRGNCERNAQLFNNGRYRTCSFRVALCDRSGQDLHYGDLVPESGMRVCFELIRAPKTAPQLFSPEIIDSVFLSPVHINKATPWADAQAITLQTIEPDQKWQALFPVNWKSDQQDGHTEQMIYVYKGRRDNDTVTGEPHYAFRYDLTIKNGRLGEESEV